MSEEMKGLPYPGDDETAKRRRNWLDPDYVPKKMREISDDDIVKLLGHRKPGMAYSSVHPPLEELKEPEDPIKELVEPTEGAKAGDRIRYAQFTDSQHLAPIPPWLRFMIYATRREFRGFDAIAYSGRMLLEMRERDIDRVTKLMLESEMFDTARCALRSITVHGFSLRLDEDGLMFDARRRYHLDKETGEVVYTKTQQSKPLEEPVSVGPPLKEEELRKNITAYRFDQDSPRDADELMKVVKRIGELKVLGGLRPDLINGK